MYTTIVAPRCRQRSGQSRAGGFSRAAVRAGVVHRLILFILREAAVVVSLCWKANRPVRKYSERMAKNKSKAQKHKDVFKVANSRSVKAKSKTKPVTTSLKKINIMNSEKVAKVNKAFTEVQKEIKNLSKDSSSKTPLQIPRCPPAEQLNVDAAVQLFSLL